MAPRRRWDAFVTSAPVVKQSLRGGADNYREYVTIRCPYCGWESADASLIASRMVGGPAAPIRNSPSAPPSSARLRPSSVSGVPCPRRPRKRRLLAEAGLGGVGAPVGPPTSTDPVPALPSTRPRVPEQCRYPKSPRLHAHVRAPRLQGVQVGGRGGKTGTS